MPRPKTTGMATAYNELRFNEARRNERADCAVVAVTAATGRPYAEVHAVMARHGRKNRRGTNMNITEAAMREFGYRMVEVSPRSFLDRYPGAHVKMRSVTTHQPERFSKVWADGNTYMLRCSGHILTVVNGVNMDWTKGKAKRVIWIYRIEKMS